MIQLIFVNIMSFETFQIKYSILEELYRDSIVVLNNSENENKVETTVAKSYMGNNHQLICVLTCNADVSYLSEEEFTVLSKILAACKLSLDDVAIINFARMPLTYQQIKQSPGYKKMILFGVTAHQISLPLSFPEYQVQSFDSATYLCLPPLSQLLGDSAEVKQLKTKIWTSLKKMFNL